ncbi:MAG: 30S ribosomal protein S15 [Bdellovibrionales bacterium]|nr:30S ribosomal protein S15 [Bdellovibrionales bacterium]
MSEGNASKLEIINKFKLHDKDTGSSEVQVALLTDRIERLSGHLKGNNNDAHSRRGLYRLVAQRKSILNYLRGEDIERYRKTVKDLGLRK